MPDGHLDARSDVDRHGGDRALADEPVDQDDRHLFALDFQVGLEADIGGGVPAVDHYHTDGVRLHEVL